jgi:tetratricopeptide (TPR) repeat protein
MIRSLSLLSLIFSLCVQSSLAHGVKRPKQNTAQVLSAVLAAPAATPAQKLILQQQELVRSQPQNLGALEKLGRLYISAARLSYDESMYELALGCAQLMRAQQAGHPQGLLLEGHALLAMHRFHEAEDLAHELLAVRQDMLDYALLGDALMEQGKESVTAYQAMIDAKPCLPSYSRVAHLRWLHGDLTGAVEMMQSALSCGSYRDPEPLAWCTTRLALHQWQLGQDSAALATLERAQQLIPHYAHAAFLKGKILLGKGETSSAIPVLQAAAEQLPLPEVLWALQEAQEAAGVPVQTTREKLLQSGAAADPRSFSLYLATTKQRAEQALDLAKAEMTTRRDVHSWDALAWAQYCTGKTAAAVLSIRHALEPGTADARLHLHAGIILKGEKTASQQLQAAQKLRSQLLPSEQRLLDQHLPTTANPQATAAAP